MASEAAVQVLESRVDGIYVDLKILKDVSQNLVITATQHGEQLDILKKIVYGACAVLGVGIITAGLAMVLRH